MDASVNVYPLCAVLSETCKNLPTFRINKRAGDASLP